jgi:hypothetical protein
MISAPSRGDILIVGASVGDSSLYSVVDAITKKSLGGPFSSLLEALQQAEQSRGNGAIWHKSVDGRGRELHAPVKLAMWTRS